MGHMERPFPLSARRRGPERLAPVLFDEPTRPARRLCAGLTLAEVMISLGVLAFVATSVIGVTFQVRSMAEQTIYQNTALVLAQGYVEQLRSLDYTTLNNAAQDSSGSVALPLAGATGSNLTNESGGTLANSSWAREIVYLDENAAGTPIQPLTFRFQPVLTSLASATSGTAQGVEIVVNYETTYNFGKSRTFTGTLRTVRSAIPTY